MILKSIELERRINDSYELNNKVIRAIPRPLVTVRTSAYQHAPYIKECIESILGQVTTFPFEYIIGEDFSNDGTREIVFDYAAKYPEKIRLLTADYNVGARVNGMRCRMQARGEYISICEGDDYWTDPYKLQKQVDFLRNHPEYSACFTNAYFLDEIAGTKRVYVQKLSEGDIEMSQIIKIGGYIYPTASLVYRISMFNPDLNNKVRGLPGDSLLIYNLAMNGKIYFMDQITCVYRRWSGGVHSGISKDQQKLNKVRIDALHGYLTLLNLTGEKYRKYLEQKISRISLSVIKYRDQPDRYSYFKYLKLKEIMRLIIWKLKAPYSLFTGKIKAKLKQDVSDKIS